MKNVKTMENLDNLEKLLRQFPGERAVFYAKKLKWSRSKVYDFLGSLQIQGKGYSKDGLWYLEGSSKPSIEKAPSEIIMKIPPSKEERESEAIMKSIAEDYDLSWLKTYLKAKDDSRTLTMIKKEGNIH